MNQRNPLRFEGFHAIDVPGRATPLLIPIYKENRIRTDTQTSDPYKNSTFTSYDYTADYQGSTTSFVEYPMPPAKRKSKLPEFVERHEEPLSLKRQQTPREFGARNGFQQMCRLPNYRGARTR